jgi:chromate transporter
MAVTAALLVLLAPTTAGQVGAIVLGGLAGHGLLRLASPTPSPPLTYGVGRRTGAILLGLWLALLGLLPLLAALQASAWLSATAVFYQAGSLVFGGGHVVLPLLQAGVVPAGWVAQDAFLAGYGAAQAVPGPLFTFAAFLGAVMPSPLGGWAGGFAMLLVIFLPGFLLVAGALPFWEDLRRHPAVQRAVAGVHAAVVGVLAATLYDPVWTSAIHTGLDFGMALAAYGLLVFARWSPAWVVMLAAAAGWLVSGG